MQTHLQTAYENAEGFLIKKSIISSSEIIVKTWDDFSEKKYEEIKYSMNLFRIK